jgi:SagB-type dehydrogenase family enzyme
MGEGERHPLPNVLSVRTGDPSGVIQLPAPSVRGDMSVEEALARRESVRDYAGDPLMLHEISQLLWAAQGITRAGDGRTAPSAGALYPVEVYLATIEGFFQYRPDGHRVDPRSHDDLRRALSEAALGQGAVKDAPAVLVITVVERRLAGRYGPRAERYATLEAGHVAQNILLQAVALGLGGVPVGAFSDRAVRRILDLPLEQRPLYLIPIGRPLRAG